MIQFSRLRLHGFKSFVERTELEIGPGLTGVVGPNGCGKSNLVEALRWSMGESSSKRMRGGSGSMEDVIFNGTEKRPARNMAEVSVLIDNTARTAPSPWNNSDEVEIVRRIERDHGSSYRINGKSARARDVQLFYADIMSGASSPYLVSQGKVTTMINSKPSERRMILEEAAGITGLYARRHEAELRLRATDNNLKRLEDIVGSMETRLQSLKKQARQAAKYRNLSAHIRQLEVTIASLEWRHGYENLREVERRFDENEKQVAERMTVVNQLTRTQNTQSQDLPDLRRQDAEMGAILQTQKLTLQRLEDEQARLESQIKDTGDQIERINTDRSHEQQTLEENTKILERIDAEEKSLLVSNDDQENAIQQKDALRESLQKDVANLEAQLTALTEQSATDRAIKQGLEQQIEQDQRRYDTVSQRLETVRSQLAEKQKAQGSDDKSIALKASIAELEATAENQRVKIEELEAAIKGQREALEDAREAFRNAQNEKSRLDNEISALESVVDMSSEDGFKPVLDEISAEEGFETALSRALGDTLMASLDDAAPVIWRTSAVAIDDLPPLPGGVKILEPHVKAPAALKHALSLIGFVEDAAQGYKLSLALKPGQSLVSADGAYWRWDGLYIKADAADRHAVQLKQKNKLLDLQKQCPAADKAMAKAESARQKALAQLEESQQALNETQAALYETDREARNKRNALNDAIEAQSARTAELAKLEEALSIAESDLVALKAQIGKNHESLAAFDDATLEARQAEIDKNRELLNSEREKLHDAIREYEAIRQEHNRRKARLQAIGDERVNLQNRCIRARERLKELDVREGQLKEKLSGLKQRPASIRKDSESLLTKITELDHKKSLVSDKLAAVETELGETTRALKDAESLLAESREARAHAQATAAERQRKLEDIKRYIAEHFDMTPEELAGQAAIDPDNTPDIEHLRQQREQAVRERDIIGPVNLRADQEAEELEQELATILSERNDLNEAITELRAGIQKLNKEARERLQAAFNHVNEHFRDMFTRLFNGGKAHLALIDSDDPLDAGLEIFAQPPGKALQSLSLLSGGEQTLTAVALIFAMFLTNPSPICVLDEVDAPLDDANVDRFCDMLEEFAARGQTRFLVITHHRLTMARMDRLYGVTMSERGVSQLVSIDLNQQLDFLEAA